MTDVKSNYDDLLESFMTNSAKAYADSSRKNDVNTQSEKDQTANRYKVYNIEIKQAADTTNRPRKKVKRRTSAATKISTFLIVFCLVFCLVADNLDTVATAYYKVKSNVVSMFSRTGTQNADWSIEANPGTLYNMKPEVWDTLSYNERLQTIENVKNIELYYLGVPYEIDLVIRDLDGTTRGEYCNALKIISIDEDHFNNSSVKEIVQTVCHECRHAYQYACIEVYNNTDENYKELNMFDNSKKLMASSLNYIEYNSEEDNYDEYSTQLVEADAFSYAAQATEEYYVKLIPEYAAEQ